ncbi:hypothetical protein BGZ46_001696 [Entomortierella lignicola]|nr:hypothetical protein BGZ46_001696 [Entomortierella lignicola]
MTVVSLVPPSHDDWEANLRLDGSERNCKVDKAIFEAKGNKFMDDPDVVGRFGPPETKRKKSNLVEVTKKSSQKGRVNQKCGVCGKGGHNAGAHHA